MHICTVATLCFPEKTFPRNYYYCVQDENSLCLCFKNMYRTLFVAIFTSTFIFSMYDHIGLPGCVFPYLSKYKYQQSAAWLTSQCFLFTNYGNAVRIPRIICSWMYTVCHFKAWGKEIIDSTVCMLNNTPYQANFGLSENLSLLLIFAEKAQLELLDPR